MTATITRDALTSADAAESDLLAQGFSLLTLDIEPVNNDAHWHHFDAEFYVLSGDLILTDVTTGTEHACGPGTRVTVPARTLHAESSQDGYRILLGTSVTPDQFGDPVNRPPETLDD